MAAVLVAHCTKVEEQKKKSSVAIERSAGELRGTRLRPSTAVARRRPYVPWGLVLWDNLSITLWGGDSAAPPHSHTWTRQRGRWGRSDASLLAAEKTACTSWHGLGVHVAPLRFATETQRQIQEWMNRCIPSCVFCVRESVCVPCVVNQGAAGSVATRRLSG